MFLSTDHSSFLSLNFLNSCTQNSGFNSKSTLSSLPSWLKDEKQRNCSNHHDQNCVSVKELPEKLNTPCSSMHKETKSFVRSLSFPSESPSSSISCFSLNNQQHANLQHNQFWANGETSLRIYIPEYNDQPNVALSSNSTSSSDVIMEMEFVPKLKEFNSENLNILSNALEKIVPGKKESIQEIVATILQCRSGMIRRKEKSLNGTEQKEETWLFFQGPDVQAKVKIARELANVVFGSYSNFVSISLSNFSSNFSNKRSRNEENLSYFDRFAKQVSSNCHCVFFLEDVEQIDYFSQRGIKKAIERGKITNSDGEEVSLDDAIIILSCEGFSSKSRACSPSVKPKKSDGSKSEEIRVSMDEITTRSCVSLNLNISIDDHGSPEDLSIDDVGLLQGVDGCIFF